MMCPHSLQLRVLTTAEEMLEWKREKSRRHEFVEYMTALLHNVTLKACQLLMTCGTTASPVTGFVMDCFTS